MIHSEEIKQKVQDLRREGWSLGELGLKTGISKSTISGWVRDIRLSEAQKRRIKEKEIASASKARQLAIKSWHKKIENWKEGIRKKIQHFGKISLRNQKIGKLVCGLLYLCEGSKYPATKCLAFGNSDPKIIRAFLDLLRKYFHIRENKLRCRIIPRWDQDINELQSFWSSITKIPLGKFYKTISDKRTKGKVTAKENYRGVCVIYYCDTSLQFELQSIGEIIIKSMSD